MGLDILLIKITKEQISEHNYLIAEDSPELIQEYSEFINQHNFKFRDEPQYTKGVFYYDELGYQRKGMKSEFYDKYKPDEFIRTQSELNELRKYVLEESLNNFDNEIYKRFKEGKNLVMMGY